MAKGIVVLRKAGKEISDDYFDRVVKVKPRCMGIAIVDPKQGMHINHIPGMVETKDIKQVLSSYAGSVLLHFGEYPQTYDKDDMQPMGILFENDELDKPLLCVAAEGDFVANTTDSAHMDSWHVAYDYLVPKVQEMYDLCGKDMDKLLVALRGKTFEKDVLDQIKTAGSLVFLDATGDCWVSIKNKKDHIHFSEAGSWTSNSLGWRPPEAVVAKDNASERSAPTTLAEKLAGFRAKMTGSSATAGEPLSSQQKPPPLTLPEKPAEPGPRDFPDPAEGPETIPIPDTVQRSKLKEIKKWCRNVCGFVPPELELDVRGNVVTDKAQVDFKTLRVITASNRDKWRAAQEAKKEKVSSKPATEVKGKTLAEKLAERRAKNITPEHIEPPEEQEAEVPETVREFVPVIPAEEKGKVEHFIIKLLDEEGKRLPVDPKKLQSMETKFATFSESFGIDLDMVDKWSGKSLYELVQDYPIAATVLLLEYRNERLEKHIEEAITAPKEPKTLAEKLAARRASTG